MEKYINPPQNIWEGLCKRAAVIEKQTLDRVQGILDRVREGSDNALREISREIDSLEPDDFEVSPREIAMASEIVSTKVKDAIEQAYRNISSFHSAQISPRLEVSTRRGVKCIQKSVPIQSVGLYIPGGTAPLFSTVLMLAIPARLAGCPTVILCTPAGKDGKVNPEVLYAASRCGISRIFKIGGAQAVAAMAYGTRSIPKVDKIFGPGNRYVTAAKQIVSTQGTAIDMPAGPSEVMVLADESANPSFVAADLLSQAEHGKDSQAILVCHSSAFADEVLASMDAQASLLPRGEMIASSLSESRAIVFDKTDTMLEFADRYAPEHLIVSMKDAAGIAEKIRCAGSVFIGRFSPESAGDYASGTNHTLPTSEWARSFSGVNTMSFMRRMTLQDLSAKGLERISGSIISMAEAEGLEAHANAVRIRMSETDKFEEDSFDPLSIVRDNIRNLIPYSTARDDYKGSLGIFLDANENPFANGFNRYPDPRQKILKEKIASIKGIPAGNLVIGNGSDEVIDLVYRIFCIPGRDNVVSICPSYGMYKVSAEINDIRVREVMLREDFTLDGEALLRECDPFTKVIFLCSPNNPSGNSIPMDDILELADSFDGIVLVDEAYIDFSENRSAALQRPNIIVLQTLSKAWGMAGLRLGLAIADERIIALMNMVKYPYNISQASQLSAVELLDSQKQKEQVKTIRNEREMLMKVLPEIPLVDKVWPSDANFLLVRFHSDANKIYDALVSKGIIVRNRNTTPLCKGCLRITVGTPGENTKLLETLKSL